MDKTSLVLTILFLFLLLIISICYVYIDALKDLYVGLTKKKRITAKLKKFAIDHDFLLLSDVMIQIRETKYIKIDYVLIGNKYIYVIASKCFYGYLNAKAIDDKWVLYKREKLMHIENPLINNRKRISLLANLLDDSIEDFVNIVYLSKPVVAPKIENTMNKNFIILEDEFEKFIEVYEKECPLNEFSVKSINEAAKKIFDCHKESIINFKGLYVNNQKK